MKRRQQTLERRQAPVMTVVQELDRLRMAAGSPSYEELAAATGRYTASWVKNALRSNQLYLVDESFVISIYRACRGRLDTSPGVDAGEVGTESEWRDFWRTSVGGRPATSPRSAAARSLRLDGGAAGARTVSASARAAVLDGTGLSATLRAMYPAYPLVSLWGIDMPITVFPSARQHRSELESPLGELESAIVPSPRWYGDHYDPDEGRESFDA